MTKLDKNNSDTFESSMTNDKKKARRFPSAIITTLLIIGLALGVWFTFNEWQESRQVLAVVIEGATWALSLGIGTAAGTSTRCCGGNFIKSLKSLFQRFKRRQTSETQLP